MDGVRGVTFSGAGGEALQGNFEWADTMNFKLVGAERLEAGALFGIEGAKVGFENYARAVWRKRPQHAQGNVAEQSRWRRRVRIDLVHGFIERFFERILLQ